MANPDIARLEGIAREGRGQILRMLTHAGSGHPGGSLSVIDLLTVLYFNVATVKPLDEEGVVGSAAKTGRVVTVEDHSIHGGLGSAVAELLGELLPTPLKRIGVTTFGESGDMKGLYAKHGLDADGITRTVLKFLNR
jgi:transketolase C-terminal domain/subunit